MAEDNVDHQGSNAEAYGDVPERFSEKHTAWACAYWDPTFDWDLYGDDDPPASLDLSFYNEELDFVGSGFMWLSAGTVDNWSGRLKMDMGPYTVWGAGTFTGKENYTKKGQYKSFGAYGYEYAGYRAFGGKVAMKVVTDPEKKLPFTAPACGWAGP